MVGALKQIQRSPPDRSYRGPIGELLEELAQGRTLGESLVVVENWLPDFDIALLHAGEQSGRLDQTFRLLQEYYQERAQLARKLISGLAYPAFLFHFAILITPFPKLFISGDWIAYLRQVLGVLLPLYGIIGVMIYAAQSGHGEWWRAKLEMLLRPIPVLGSARHAISLSRLAAALEALLSAGVNVVPAWEMAARASGSPSLSRTVKGWGPSLDAGETPAEAVSSSRQFPELFASQYTTGEISGSLDTTLKRLQVYYQEEASRKLQMLSRWVPMAVYIGVMLMIAYNIVQFWIGHFRDISNAAGW